MASHTACAQSTSPSHAAIAATHRLRGQFALARVAPPPTSASAAATATCSSWGPGAALTSAPSDASISACAGVTGTATSVASTGSAVRGPGAP
eukprot:5163228-Prymnesium_polylepis.1